MLYLLDFFFVIGYLTIRRVFRKMHEADSGIFFTMIGLIGWCEFGYVMLWIYYLMPQHNVSEGLVSFSMAMATKLAFQLGTNVFTKRKHGTERPL